MSHLSPEVRAACRFFAFVLGNGTLAGDVLGEIDYRRHLVEFGSELEMVLAIFLNVLEVDADGRVVNEAAAQRRAAQWIRQYNDPGYEVTPPWEDWETELHGP